MKMTLLILGTLLSIVSCGKGSGTGKSDRSIIDQTAAEKIVPLRKQKLKCDLKYFASDATTFKLNLFEDGHIREEQNNFSSLLNGLRLEDNQSVSATIFNNKAAVKNNNGSKTVVSYSDPLYVEICPEVKEFEKDTIESAALNATFVVSKTYHKFKSLVSDIEVKPIYIDVAPIIADIDVANSKTTFRADNAYYSPGVGSITFLPHSVAWKSLYDLSFWEVPMITSHEYGHHIFQSIYQEDLASFVSRECFSSITQGLKQTAHETKLRSVNVSNVLAAYNEGFADLISFYSLGKVEGSVDGVKCLDTNRDVTKSYFHYLIPKTFSHDVLESFFSEDTINESQTCEYPSFQDEHVLGAIFAHRADKILNLMTTSNDEKLKALVEWVKYLKTLKYSVKYKNPEDYLKETFKKFVTLSATTFKAPYDTTLCSEVEVSFPDLGLPECLSR